MGCTEKVIENGKIVYRDCKKGSFVTQENNDGPGTELKNILKNWFGIEATLGCKCNAMSKKMNRLGPDWCENEGMQEILEAMKNEHDKRKKNGETILPWTDFGAKQLIKLACNRARY